MSEIRIMIETARKDHAAAKPRNYNPQSATAPQLGACEGDGSADFPLSCEYKFGASLQAGQGVRGRLRAFAICHRLTLYSKMYVLSKARQLRLALILPPEARGFFLIHAFVLL